MKAELEFTPKDPRQVIILATLFLFEIEVKIHSMAGKLT